MDPLSLAGQAVSAAQRQQQLASFKDAVLIDAVASLAATVTTAAKGIVDEAEAILTSAKVCRLDNDDDVHALHVRIAHYFEDHPRLTTLRDALPPLDRLLDELAGRANRKLQLSKTRDARRRATIGFLDAVDGLKAFMKELGFEFEYLPAKTGLAASAISELDRITQLPEPLRKEKREQIAEHVQTGRVAVEESRANSVSAKLDAALAQLRVAF